MSIPDRLTSCLAASDAEVAAAVAVALFTVAALPAWGWEGQQNIMFHSSKK